MIKSFSPTHAGQNASTINPLRANTNTVEFANSVDPNEVAHNEPPHQDIHCLPSHFLNAQYEIAWPIFFFFLKFLQAFILSFVFMCFCA